MRPREIQPASMMIHIDYTTMILAANEWGPPNDDARRYFLNGWIDERDGMYGDSKPKGDLSIDIPHEVMCNITAYNSGVIAYREFKANGHK